MHSNPGVGRILYLDFDGHTQAATKGWGAFDAPAYDPTGNGDKFDADEKRRITMIWQRVAEDYIIFDVDVTTEEPPVLNGTTARCVITRSVDRNGKKMPSGSAGGIAYVGLWGSAKLQNYGPAFGEIDVCRGGACQIVKI